MRKLFSIFTAMLAALAVSATPVVLPATLDVSNVSFRSEDMPDFVLAEGDYAGTYFDMGAHDNPKDTLLYAEWDVTIEPLKYDIDVVVHNTNSWTVQLYLLNQKGDTVKNLRYKGSSGKSGKFAIGSMDMKDLEAGNYKLRARAARDWSAMKLKEVVVKADYSGATVALPGKLLPAYAELSANASVTDDAIAFKPSTAPDEYATWNVTFAKAGSFDVTIDMTASNGHNYGVALLSADGGTEIGAVNEGGQKGDTGEKALGSIAVPAAGKYIVKLTNSIQWSEAVLNSITFAAPYEPAMKTIYCKMTQDWWTKDGAAVGIYTWDDGGNKKAEWPGERMTAVEGEEGIWSFELDVNKYHMCIFTRVNASGDIADWGAKTKDLTIPTDDKDLFTITTAEAVWSDPGCEGEWSKFEAAAPVVDEWVKIIFTEAVAADALAEDATFAVLGSEFALKLHDAGNKMSIDANDCRFGTAEDYTMYNYRIKSGGASSSDKNYFTLNIPEAGILRIAPRTSSSGATDRALVIAQGDKELYNAVVQESQATEVQEGDKKVNVYPYVEVKVAKGEVRVSYTAGMNFYAFAFKAEEETPAGCDWDNIDWLGDGSAEQTFGSQFKVCVGDPAPTSVVNIQTSFGTETGIYVTFPSTAFGAISLPEGKYAIQGAGMLLYVSAFVAKETEVSVVCDNKEIVFTVYNAKGTDTPTAIESNVVAVKTVKMIENGQLVIIRGGEKFNAQGQLIR